MARMVRTISPSLDGGPVIRFPGGAGPVKVSGYGAPVWLQNENGDIWKVGEDPWQGTISGSSIEVLSEEPQQYETVTGDFSDWRTQANNVGHQESGTPGSLDRLRDFTGGVYKWGGAFRQIHLAVVPAPTGRNLRFHNCMEVVHQSTVNSGSTDMVNFALVTPAVGDTYNFGLTLCYDMLMAAGAENGNHGFRHGDPRNWELLCPYWIPDDDYWTFWFWTANGNSFPNDEWGIWTNGTDEAFGSNNHSGAPLLLKDHFYEFIIQMEVLSDTTMRFYPFVFDAETNPRELLYTYTDFYNQNMTAWLGDEPILNFDRTDFANESRFGSNGGMGPDDWTTPLPHFRMAAFRCVIGQQMAVKTPLPPYGYVEGEVPV